MQALVFFFFAFFKVILTLPVTENEAHKSKPLENLHLFQGDIKLPPKVAEVRTGKEVKTMYATAFDEHLWPGGVVYYNNFNITDNSFLDIVDEAMTEIESNTCIRFVEKSWYHKDYINLISGYGCWSYVGKVGGAQDLSLGEFHCRDKNLIIHELMHSIGFYHKHSQNDRDQYLKIHWNNIIPEARPQFDKLPSWQTKTFADFDYMSIMLYGPRLFSLDYRFETMSRRDGVRLMDVEDKPGISYKDVYSINQLYKCREGV